MDCQTFKLSCSHQQYQYRHKLITIIPLSPAVEDYSSVSPECDLLLMTPQERLSLPHEFYFDSPTLQSRGVQLLERQQDRKALDISPTLIQRSQSSEKMSLSVKDDDKFILMTPKEKINRLEIDSFGINSNKKFRLEKRPYQSRVNCTNFETRPLPRPTPRQYVCHSSTARSTRQLKKRNSINDDILHDPSCDIATSMRQSITKDGSNTLPFNLVKPPCYFRPIHDDED